MLRLIFVGAIAVAGLYLALQHPYYALLLYLWNAYFRPESWVWDPELVLRLRLSYVFAVVVIGMCVLRGRAFSTRPLLTGHMALVGLFAMHGLASALLSPHSAYALPYWIEFAKVAVITSLIVGLVDDLPKLRTALLVVAYSMGFEGAKQGWAELVRRPGQPNSNPIPFLGDNNGVAVGMFMLVPIFAALARSSGSSRERNLHRFFMFGVLYRGLTTYSRGGFLSCLALALVWLSRSPRKVRDLLVMLTASALILPVLPTEFWDRMNTIMTYEESEEDSALSRLYFWELAVAMARSRPALGVGFNSFNAAFDDYDTTSGAYGSSRSVHSSWFGVLAELGFVGLALYSTIFALAVRNCWLARRVDRVSAAPGALGALASALEASLVVYFVGGTFLPHQYNEMAWHCVGFSVVLLGLARQLAARHAVARRPWGAHVPAAAGRA